VSWLFLSVGLLFWIVLLTIVFNRLIFHHPMPPHLLPTLCILIAPPAVAFLAYESLAGEVDGFARLLYYPAVVFFLLVAIQVPRLVKLPFALSWWAYSFPLAALTVATFVMAEKTGLAVFAAGGIALYALLLGVVGWLVVRTVVAIRRHGICKPHL
jgi:tellurite resistance protein